MRPRVRCYDIGILVDAMHLNKKYVVSWTLFDFANSSYSAVIAAVVFPVYYTTFIVGNETGLGDLWWGRAVACSMAFVAVISPFLGGIADVGGYRKRFLFFFTALSVLAVGSLALLEKGMVVEGFLLVVAANIGMEGGLVFYNSFLPRICPRAYQGRVSAWGYMVGYGGSILSLLIALPLMRGGYVRETWIMVAAFFALFSIPAFIFLPRDVHGAYPLGESARKGFRQALSTFRGIVERREPAKFLLSYFIYEDGVSTVIVFSSIFAATTLGFQTQELIFLYLTVQATALVGSLVMAKPIDHWGPKKVVMLSLVLWSTVAVGAFFVTAKNTFWGVALCAGLGLGTVQAASRALFAQFIPEGKEAEYFGVYSLAGKTSAIMGPILFGSVSTTFGSQRPAILSVAAFFVVGLLILFSVRGGGPNVSQRNG